VRLLPAPLTKGLHSDLGSLPALLKDDPDPLVPGRPDRCPGRGSLPVRPNRPPTPRSGAYYSGMEFFATHKAEILRGLDNLQEVEALFQGKRFVLRSQLIGQAHKAFKAAGVALPPTLRDKA